ncbi:hypothetical protein ACJX0J_037122 [Zea mays]
MSGDPLGPNFLNKPEVSTTWLWHTIFLYVMLAKCKMIKGENKGGVYMMACTILNERI